MDDYTWTDQQRFTYICSVRALNSVLRICQERWTIGTDGKRKSQWTLCYQLWRLEQEVSLQAPCTNFWDKLESIGVIEAKVWNTLQKLLKTVQCGYGIKETSCGTFQNKHVIASPARECATIFKLREQIWKFLHFAIRHWFDRML